MRRPSLACCLLLAACGGGVTAPERKATAPIADPAITAAINAPILIDPGLDQLANADAVRPAPAPDPLSVPPDMLGLAADAIDPAKLRPAPASAGPCPRCRLLAGALTLGAVAERAGAGGPCAATIRYASGWAGQLPRDLPLPPGARVVEAAGSDAAGCGLRVVSLLTASPPSRLTDWFNTRARAAGFSVQHGADGTTHLLEGSRGGRAYLAYLVARPDGGTDATVMTRGID